LRSAALAAPKTAAFIGVRGVTSYEELDRLVSAAAFRLGELELGSRVALHLQRDERYVALLLALIRAGHVACPLSDRIPPRGVTPLLGKAACSALISDDEELLRTAGANLLRPKPEDLLR
jgi:acyl-CoA synthetase (AMP-forming)/AMP-acid ligase II